jgi:hypothetical protein
VQVIITQNNNGGVSVIIPAPEYADQIEAVAQKDVPAGRPFRIIEDSDLPSRGSRARWLWTESGPLNVATETEVAE